MAAEAREAAEAAATATQNGHSLLEVAPLVLVSMAFSMIELAEAVARLADRWGTPEK